MAIIMLTKESTERDRLKDVDTIAALGLGSYENPDWTQAET